MRKILLALALLSISITASAVDELFAVSWDLDATAVSYRVYVSTDGGVSWVLGGESAILPIEVPLPRDDGATPPVTLNVNYMMRGCSVNTNGEVCKVDRGFWFNPSMSPPAVPVDLTTP